jgi:arsenate reductase
MAGKPRVLFLCTGNSARSQMAEAFLRSFAGDRFDVVSAGTDPVPVNPRAIGVMTERGMDISHQRSRGVKEFLGRGVPYLITVCDQANERCPIIPGAVNRLHWSFEDPAAAKGPDEERICVSRRVRDEIEAAVRRFAKEVEEHRPLTGAISSTKAPAAA